MIATVTISNTSGSAIASGTTVDTNSLPFDHAALVTGLQSRADGYDFRMTDSAGKVAGLVSLANPNASNTRIRFNLVNTLANGATETYTLEHGYLGQIVSPFTATLSGDAAVGMAITWAVPALPVPSFPFAEARPRLADESAYPETLSARVNYRNNTPRRRYSLAWAALEPIAWYELRAFVHGQRGGAYTFTESQATFLPNGTYAVVPNTFSVVQSSRLGFAATLEIAEVLP